MYQLLGQLIQTIRNVAVPENQWIEVFFGGGGGVLTVLKYTYILRCSTNT